MNLGDFGFCLALVVVGSFTIAVSCPLAVAWIWMHSALFVAICTHFVVREIRKGAR